MTINNINEWNIDVTWTLFLDRDGVINERIMGGYVTSIDEFKFIDGVEKAIAKLSKLFFRVIVVTNQQGIGKGLMTERDLIDIHSYMCDQVYLAGGKIDKCYFAPNLKGAKNDMRKPAPVMAELAKMQFPEIEFEKSIMVGDTDSDILFGKNLGMKTVRIDSDEPASVEADLVVKDLNELLNLLK